MPYCQRCKTFGMTHREENNEGIITFEPLSVIVQGKRNEGKFVFQKKEYEKAVEYAREKLLEFREETKIDLKLHFKHEKMEFDFYTSNLYGQDTKRKSLEFVDGLNINLKEILKT